MITTVREAANIIGVTNASQFCEASKMPCPTYSISAEFCKTGNKLAMIPGTPCSKCYALRKPNGRGGQGGWYMIPRVIQAQTRRLLALLHNPRWTEAFNFLLQRYNLPFFRWHDSGDLQSVSHLAKLFFLAKENPNTKFWLPTQEWSIVEKYWHLMGEIPLNQLAPNLIIRLSARNIDGETPDLLAKKLGVTVSKVSSKKFNCPASLQGDKCLDCRKCWNQDIFSVSYHLH